MQIQSAVTARGTPDYHLTLHRIREGKIPGKYYYKVVLDPKRGFMLSHQVASRHTHLVTRDQVNRESLRREYERLKKICDSILGRMHDIFEEISMSPPRPTALSGTLH